MENNLYFKSSANGFTRWMIYSCIIMLCLFTANVNAQITVTSGGASLSASYTSLTNTGGLFEALNAASQSGQTIAIAITSNSLAETGTVPLTGAAGMWTSLTFTPAGAVTVSGSVSASGLIDLNGADNVTFDGINSGGNSLTIMNTTTASTANTATIRFINDATNNTFRNCVINGAATGTNTATIFFSTSPAITVSATGNDGNIITLNNIGPVGTNTPLKSIYSSGQSTTIQNSGIQITNNNIFDFFKNTTDVAFGVHAFSGSTDWTITGNSLYQTATRTMTGASGGFIGISAENTSGNNFTINDNYIGGSAASAGGTAWTQTGAFTHTFIGIRLSVGTTTASNVQNNRIQNLSISTSNASTINAGISVPTGNVNIGNVTGNIIGSGSGTGNITYTGAAASSLAGIYVGTGTPGAINVSGNTIGSITIAGAGTTTFRGIRCEGTVVTSLTVANNTIGSASTANSITSNSNVPLVGISTTNTGQPISCTGNTIANLQHTSATTAATVKGIEALGAINGQTISGNTIRNYTTVSTNTNAATTSSVVGITLSSASTGNVVSNNTIRDLSNTAATAAVTVQGIYIAATASTTMSRNNIYNLSVSSTSTTAQVFGIFMFNSSATENVYNNMIRLGTGMASNINPIIRGIYENTAAGSPTNIYYNSVFIGGTQGAATVNTACLMRSTGSAMDVKNNIFWNNRVSTGTPGAGTGHHYALQATNTSTAGTSTFLSNNNILYTSSTTSGGAVGFWVSDQLTLANWQTVTAGRDVASFSSDPKFIDATSATTPDLHLSPSLSTDAEGTGANLASPTDDFDGTSRASLSPNDIGADAGNFVGTTTSIGYTNLSNTTSTSDRTTTSFATIYASAGVENTAGIAPRLYYKKSSDVNAFNGNSSADAGWKYVESTTGSSPYDFTIDYSKLTTAVVVGDVIQYFVVAQSANLGTNPRVGINAGAFTSAPASVALTSGAFPILGTLNSYTILQSYSGNKTVCPSGCDFTGLTVTGGAFALLNAGAVTGDLTLQIAGDLTSETGAVALNEFASPYFVTIKPTSVSRAITGTSASGLITLNGADRVTIDGSLGTTTNSVCNPSSTASRNLTITNTNSGTSSAVVWIQTAASGATTLGATNNTIKNCNIVGNSNTTTLFGIGSGSNAIGTSSLGTGNNNNSIINNSVSKTQYGIYSQGASALNKNTGTIINLNDINTASPNNVQLSAIVVGFDDGVVISKNNISGITTTGDLVAITLGYGNAMSTTNTTGNDVTNATITKNTIGTVVSTSATGFSAAGIAVSAVTTGTTLIANNIIYGVIAPSTSGDLAAGIYAGCGTGSTTQIYYNTVSMTGARGAASYSSYALAVNGSTPTIDIKNNILVNTQTSTGAGQSYAIGLSYTGTTGNYANLLSDHNDFFTSGGNAAFTKVGSLNQGTGTNKTTLTGAGSWNEETGRDGGGTTLSLLPGFISLTDYHTDGSNAVNIPLNNGAVSVSPTVTDDIDCEVRATDIGADEFVPVQPPTITFNSITPSTVSQCTAAARTVSIDAVPVSGTLTSVTISYNNGTATGPVLMTNTGGNTYQYTIPVANPTNSTVTWSVTAKNSLGGSVTYNGAPYKDDPVHPVASASPTLVCSGSTSTLSVAANVGVVVGAGSGTSATYGISPFPGLYGGAKTQYIILASELSALGYTAGPIKAVEFEVTTAGGPYPGFAISLGNTSQSAASTGTGLIGGLTEVYANASYTPVVGVNTFNLTSPFSWNGTDNLVISMCFSTNATTSTTTTLKTDAVSFVSSYAWRVDSQTPAAVCGTTGVPTLGGATPTTTSSRPKFRIEGAGSSYTWSASNVVIGTTNPLTVTVTANTVYTVSVYDALSGCTAVATTSVNVTPSTQALNITASPLAAFSLPISWTNGNGVSRVVLMNTSNLFTTPTGSPGANTVYSGSGQQCIYNGTGTSVTVTGLTSNTTYWFRVYENGCLTIPNYNSSTATNNPNSFTTIAVPIITFNSITGSACSATSVPHTVSIDAVPTAGTMLSVTISYNNGTAAGPILMSGPSGNTYTFNIPAAAVANTVVTWSVTATNSGNQSTTYTGAPYNDNPIAALTAVANASSATFCTGTSVVLTATILNPASPAPTGYCAATVTNSDEDDIGQVTFAGINNPSVRPTPQVSNAASTGTYSDFTASTPGTVSAGSTYPITIYQFFSETDQSTNACLVYIDFNQNGNFSEANEVFTLGKTSFLADYTGNITIPTTALPGRTRMRVELGEIPVNTSCGTISGWGEVEDYILNVAGIVGGSTYAWTGTIDGAVGTNNPQTVSPSATQSYSASVGVTYFGCSTTLATNSVTLTTDNTAPTTQALNITLTSTGGGTSLPVTWTNGNGEGRVVLMNTTGVFTPPADGSNPATNTVWQNGGTQCVFNSTAGNSVIVTGLSGNTTYHFRVFEYRCVTGRIYNTGTATNNPNSFTTSPALAYGVVRNTDIAYTSIIAPANAVTFSANDDGGTGVIPIPGPSSFTFQGQTVTGFKMVTNGYIILGTPGSAPNTSNTYVNNFGGSGITNVVAPFWDDLLYTPGVSDAAVKIDGAIGSRTLTVEWYKFALFQNASPQLSFQIVWSEATNVITFNYGLFQGYNGTVGTNHRYAYSVGFAGKLVNAFPLGGQVFAQQYENSTSFSNNQVAAPNVGANNLMVLPQCATQLVFTPNAPYTYSVPAEVVKNGVLDIDNDNSSNPVDVPCEAVFPSNLCGHFYSSRFASTSSETACAGNNDDDVWFIFDPGAATAATVRVYGSGGYVPRVQVLDEFLNTFAGQCVVSPAAGGTVDAVLTGLTPGSYFVRVYHDGGGIQATGTAIISNGAVTGVTMTNNGSGYTLTSTTGLSESTPRMTFVGGDGFDAVAKPVVTGGAITSVTMSSGGYGYTVAPSVVFEKPNWAHTGEFALVVYAPAPNDECAGAINLFNLNNTSCVNGENSRDGESTTTTTMSTAEGTPSCASAGENDDDIWYKFTATTTSTNISVTGHTSFDPAFQVWNGGTGDCSTKTTNSTLCFDASTGLTETGVVTTQVGKVYYVRVWHAAAGAGGVGSSFDICVSTYVPTCIASPTSPANGGNACSSGFTASWPVAPGATGYYVYVGTGGIATTLIATNTPGTNNSIAIPAQPVGTYNWRVVPFNAIGEASGCATWSVNIIDPPTVSVTPGSTPSYCAGSGGSVSLTASGATTYTWTPALGLSATTGATVSANPAATTTYTVNGSLVAGCSGIGTQTITIIPVPPAPSTTSYTVCVGGSIPSGYGLTATCSGTGGNLNWYDQPTGGTTLGSASPFDPIGTPTLMNTNSAGSYPFYARCDNGTCQSTGGLTYLVVSNIALSISSLTQSVPALHCGGVPDQLTAVVSGGGQPYIYSWSPTLGLNNATISNPIATPNSTTTYTLTVSGGCSQTATASITVSVDPAPPSAITPPTASFCSTNPTPIVLTAAAGADSYSWAPTNDLSATSGNVVTATPINTTTYVVTATYAASGCTSTSSTTIFIGQPVSVTASGTPTAICSGGSSQLNSTISSSATGGYAVTSTTYGPVSTAGFTTLSGMTDDGNSGAITLPFSFTFYGNAFSTAYISSNGGIGFTATSLGATSAAIPTAATPNNFIAMVWVDLLPPSGGTISYGTVGTSPNRKFVVDYNAVPLYLLGNPTGSVSGQIWLYEGSNVIETHITLLDRGSSVKTGVAGIENSDGTSGTVPPGRELGTWSIASPEAWRFFVSTPPSYTYSWSPSANLNSSTISNPLATNLTAASTTFTVTVTDVVGGCTGTATVTVANDPLTSATISSPNNTVCLGSSTTLNASSTGGGIPIRYEWSPATGLNATTGSSVIATPLTTTNYVVTAIDFCNTSISSNPFTVNVETAPTITATSPQNPTTICGSGSVTLNASGAGGSGTYKWSPSTGLNVNSLASVTANPTTTTTYTVVGTTANGCTNAATITVNYSAPLSIIPTADASTGCEPFSTQLHAGYTNIINADYSVISISPAPVSTTGFTVVTGLSDDGNSGLVNLPFVFNFYGNNYSTASISSNGGVIFGTAASLGSAPASIPTAATANNFAAMVWVDLLPPSGGTISYGVTGSAPNRIFVVDYNAVPRYLGGNPTGSVSGQLWLREGTGVIESHLTLLDHGSATTSGVIGIENSNGSLGTVPTGRQLGTWSVSTPEAWRFIPTNALASGYSWTPSSYLSSTTDGNPNVVNMPAGTTTYTVTVTDANGCTGTGSIALTVNPSPPAPPIGALGATVFCAGGSVTLQTTPLPNGTYTGYTWAPASSLDVTTGATVVATPTVTTTYTLTAYSANGCSSTSTILVTVATPTTPSITPNGPLTFCSGKNVTLTAGSGYSSYSWSPAAGLNTTSGAVVVASTAGTFTVTVTNGAGCTNTNTVVTATNTPPSAPVATLIGTIPLCEGDALASVLIDIPTVAGLTYAWNDNTTTSTEDLTVYGDNLDILGSGVNSFDFHVTVTDANGCTATSNDVTVTTIACNGMTLNMRMYIQGFYKPSTGFMDGDPLIYPGSGCLNILFQNGLSLNSDPEDVDTINVSLMDEFAYTLVETQRGILKRNGDLSVTFSGPAVSGNNYWIQLKHRNLLETWSKGPVYFTSLTTYDFTTASTQAYDEGQTPLFEVDPGVWAVFNGDINQSGDITSLDMTEEENDANANLFGYQSSDLDGDLGSTSLDMTLIENNSFLNAYLQDPIP